MDIIFNLITFLNSICIKAQACVDAHHDGYVVMHVNVCQGTVLACVATPCDRTEVLIAYDHTHMYMCAITARRFSTYVATAEQAAALGLPMTKHVVRDYTTIELGYDANDGIAWHDLSDTYEYCDDDYEYSRLETQAESDAADRADDRAQARMMAASEW